MNKKSKLKKFLLITGIVIGVFFIGIVGYGYYLYHSVKETATEVYKPLHPGESDSQSLEDPKEASILPLQGGEKEGTPSVNILLLGVDERANDKGRSDTMIVASLNPEKHSLLMTSIPRDTRVHISGHSGYSKINAAYAFGDESLAVGTVEDYLNIKIPYYVKINMEGLADLVDAVGGVTVNNDLEWYDRTIGFHFTKGPLHLNGKQALSYARERHRDPRGDFGRNKRQRQVIRAVINKGKSFTAVKNIQDILNAVGHNVQTNLTFDDMKVLATDYRQCRQNITSYETKGTPKYIDGISWVLVSDQERQHVHEMIRSSLSN